MAKNIHKNRSRALAKKLDGYVDHNIAIQRIAEKYKLKEDFVEDTVLAFFGPSGLGKYMRLGYKAHVKLLGKLFPQKKRANQIKGEIKKAKSFLRRRRRLDAAAWREKAKRKKAMAAAASGEASLPE